MIADDIEFNNSNKGSLEVMKEGISKRIEEDPRTFSFDELLKAFRQVCTRWTNNSMWNCSDYKVFLIVEYHKNNKIKN